VAGIIIHDGRILLSVRGKPPSEGKWGLPGGAVEVGETVEEALVREVTEETSVTVRPLKLVAVLDSVNRDEDGGVKYHYVLFEYLCGYVAGEVHPGSDAPDARWVPLGGLDSVDMMPTTRRFVEKILEQEKDFLPHG
jgi:ADP-ribose pyrophosphatase YjhB (NUDIX family)